MSSVITVGVSAKAFSLTKKVSAKVFDWAASIILQIPVFLTMNRSHLKVFYSILTVTTKNLMRPSQKRFFFNCLLVSKLISKFWNLFRDILTTDMSSYEILIRPLVSEVRWKFPDQGNDRKSELFQTKTKESNSFLKPTFHFQKNWFSWHNERVYENEGSEIMSTKKS